MRKPTVFISYSHKDAKKDIVEAWREEQMLRRVGFLHTVIGLFLVIVLLPMSMIYIVSITDLGL